jgi:hypothetical protein
MILIQNKMTKSTDDLLTLSLQTLKKFLIPIVTDVETWSCNRHTETAVSTMKLSLTMHLKC